ncbi:nonribosomal peptide synthetase MxcG, partial [Rhizobiales bacterium GAS188]
MTLARPLSAAQFEIWLAQKLDPDSPPHSCAAYVDIPGAIDVALFERALRYVVDELETLHIQIIEDDEGPKQNFASLKHWSLTFVDMTGEPNPFAAASAWMQSELGRPMNLALGPLFAFALFKLGGDRFVCFWRIHHIAVDGATSLLIARDVALIYTALMRGQALAKPQIDGLLSLLLDDWDYRHSKRFEDDQAFWLGYLADWSEPQMLAGKSAPASPSPLRHSTTLSHLDGDAFDQAAAALGVAWPQLAIAAIAGYVHRMTGGENVALSLVLTGRSPKTRRAAGM